MDSVKEIGIRHPISICFANKPYKIISGHKRVLAAIKAGLTSIPAFLFPTMDGALVLNLKENFALRHYSDIEKGRILNKLLAEGIQEKIHALLKNSNHHIELVAKAKSFIKDQKGGSEKMAAVILDILKS